MPEAVVVSRILSMNLTPPRTDQGTDDSNEPRVVHCRAGLFPRSVETYLVLCGLEEEEWESEEWESEEWESEKWRVWRREREKEAMGHWWYWCVSF